MFIENKSYVYTADDDYLYNVKMPDYLTYTGNLCVSVPKGECALLICPKVIGDYDYGVQIQIGEEIYISLSSIDNKKDRFKNEPVLKFIPASKDYRKGRYPTACCGVIDYFVTRMKCATDLSFLS